MQAVKLILLFILFPLLAKAVIGGSTAALNEFPFIVNIWMDNPKDNYNEHLCGGSLIDPKWVLTAAHCMVEEDSESTQRPVKPSELKLYIGSNKISGAGGRLLKVRSVHIHPDFAWPKHDVALIELSEPVLDITPVLLNTKDFGSTSIAATAIVMGWGLTEFQGKTEAPLLQKVEVPLISRKLCAQDEFPRSRSWDIGSDTLCTETNFNQKTSCPGDSGGPLVQQSGQRFLQIGLVSWGSACGNNKSSNVGGFSDVSDAAPWIQQTLH